MTTKAIATKTKELVRDEFIHKYTHESGIDVFLWRSNNGVYFFDVIMPDEEETTYSVFSNVKSVAKSREENEKAIEDVFGMFPRKSRV